MKTKLLIFTVLFFAFNTFSQTINRQYLDGTIYFKIKNNTKINLPIFNSESNEISEYNKYQSLQTMMLQYDVTKLVKPFKTQTENVQNIYKIEFRAWNEIDNFVAELKTIKYIEYAEKSLILTLFSTPNDDSIVNQWFLDNIQAYEAWDLVEGNPNVKVAIVDDASRISHPDLADNVWHNPNEIADNGIDDDNNGFIDDVNGWDAKDEDNDPEPPADLGLWGETGFTHGTHCAGLAAGVTNNGIGIASVSYNVSYIPIKTVSDDSWFPLGIEAPAEGVDYAINAGADIISMSFGGADTASFQTLRTLLDAANDAGIICVAAAGNDGEDKLNYPAGFDNVIAVGASDIDDKVTDFSQFGDWVDIMSPGKAMFSTLAHSSPYGNEDGTSMACPLTAGAIALLKSYAPLATKDEIISCLYSGCDNIDSLNPDFIGKMGSGRLNIYKSLLCFETTNIKSSQQQQMKIFPNPSSSIINIAFSERINNLKIYDIIGNKIFENNSIDNKNTKLNVSNFGKGIYFVKINNSYTEKLIVK